MELFIDLGLKEIASIINRMGLTTGVEELHEEGIILNGKEYKYDKKGNEVVITDSLGKQTNIRINYESIPGKDAYNRDVTYIKHEVSIDYIFPDGSFINLSNDIALDPGYESFENVHRHDILSGIRTKYCNKDKEELASFNLELSKICLKKNNSIYEFSNDGIVCGKRLLTLDGSTLVSVSGSEIPSKELAESFDLEKEQGKLKKIIEDNKDLHPFTVEAVEDSIRKLDRKERYVKDIVDYYNTDIKDVRKVIAIRQELMDKIDNNILDKDGLEMVAEDFYKRTKNSAKIYKRF